MRDNVGTFCGTGPRYLGFNISKFKCQIID